LTGTNLTRTSGDEKIKNNAVFGGILSIPLWISIPLNEFGGKTLHDFLDLLGIVGRKFGESILSSKFLVFSVFRIVDEPREITPLVRVENGMIILLPLLDPIEILFSGVKCEVLDHFQNGSVKFTHEWSGIVSVI
jgi:hypothetical protein